MTVITIYQLPRESGPYLRNLVAESNRVFYTKYIVDKIGLFAPSKGLTVEWQVTRPWGSLILGDLLRRRGSLYISVLSQPGGGLVRFALRSRRAQLYEPDPNVISRWSYSIQQDEAGRLWTFGTTRIDSNDMPSLIRSKLGRNSGTAEYWVLPPELAYPYRLRYDKGGRIWFSVKLQGTPGLHQFGVLDPATGKATGFTIDGIGTAGISDLEVDTRHTTVWLTHRQPDSVYRYDWNSLEAIAYEDPALSWPGLTDLSGKRVPLFVSGDGHVNTLDPDRKTGIKMVSASHYTLQPRVTELAAQDLTVTETQDPVAVTTVSEPEIYAGPFMRWPVPAITGGPTLVDIKRVGNKAYFTEMGDARLGMIPV